VLIDEMTEHECHEFLERASFGRLGCSLGDQPYIVPVCLAYESDCIYVFSTFGKKIEWMRANPKVCIQVDEIADQSQWVSVIVNGRYEELPERQYAAEREHARKLLKKRSRWWLNTFAERLLKLGDKLIEPLFFRIHIDSMTGLRATDEIGDINTLGKTTAQTGPNRVNEAG
jgi:nitroimidazol reductase NimA-like FMN-containing flavoprotein (pyridoxamine 5'-phosphate oxidase superfamily)